MSFLRSRSISNYQIVLPRQNCHRVVAQMGRMGVVQFKNTHPDPNLMPFLPQLKICDQHLNKLKQVEEQMHQQGMELSPHTYSQAEYDVFLETADRRYRLFGHSHIHLFEKVVEELSAIWDSNQQLIQRKRYLQEELQMLTEEICLLNVGKKVFGQNLHFINPNENDTEPIRYTLGVLLKRDEFIFKRTVFRMSRGLSLLLTFEEESEMLNKKAEKEKRLVFYLFYGYGPSSVFQAKINKLFQIYHIVSYTYPKTQEQLQKRLSAIERLTAQNLKLQELVQTQVKDIYSSLLQQAHTQSQTKLTNLQYYRLYLLHEKMVYQQINQMKTQHSFVQAQIFLPSEAIQTLTIQLQASLAEDRMPIPQLIPIFSSKKPTLFYCNIFTNTQYQVLKAYGVPHYQEVNPAFFNIVTFPFLFGVMFGDIAHGLILLAFGLLLAFYPRLFGSKFVETLIPHKWSIVLMGFFSAYCGLIYNQFLSISLNIFGSCYSLAQSQATLQENCVYPLGVDPVWSIANNNLQFTNSLKMKMSVIIAVAHMTLGLFLKILNQIHQRNKLHIVFQTLPQIVFLVVVFGYMDFLIIYKWIHQWNPSVAPSIITTMINIPLQMGSTEDCCGGQPMWGQPSNTSQNSLQLAILAIAIICIPLILCLKPLHTLVKRRKRNNQIHEEPLDFQSELRASRVSDKAIMRENLLLQEEKHAEEVPVNQIIVVQLIETIEFVLGCISNTASYLRLWALSLAHSSLSEVFFEQTVQRGLQVGFVGIPIGLVLFPIFAGMSFGILLCMDTMECFLHTLRLHWVEFQSKFYKGDGDEFRSLSFSRSTNEWLQSNSAQ